MTAVRLGFRHDGDKEVSQPKTEAMAVRERLTGTASSERDYSAAPSNGCSVRTARGCPPSPMPPTRLPFFAFIAALPRT